MSRANRSKTVPIITIAIGLILMGAAAYVGFFSDDVSPEVTTAPPLTVQDVPRISPDEAKESFDTGEAVFIDVRDLESYESGHIPGALPIPLGELESRLEEIPKDRLIIPY